MEAALTVVDRRTAIVGEGLRWDPHHAQVVWVDHEDRTVFLGVGDDAAALRLDGDVAAALPTEDPDLLLVFVDAHARLLRPSTGASWRVGETGDDPALLRVNEAGVGPDRRVWADTARRDEAPGDARLLRLQDDGSCVARRAGMGLGNGIGWSPDGAVMYVIDSLAKTITRFAYADEDVDAGAVFIDTGDLTGLPDGLAVDARGNLWIAFWEGSAVRCFSGTDGRLLHELALPVSRVTTCCFGGPALDRLYIATASYDADLEREPLAGAVFATEVGVSGLPPSLARIPPAWRE